MLPVTILTLDRFRLLKQTLNSLRKNSRGAIYTIVVDDGSTDIRAKELLAERASIKEIHLVTNKKRMGVGYSRNLSIETIDKVDVLKDSKYFYISISSLR